MDKQLLRMEGVARVTGYKESTIRQYCAQRKDGFPAPAEIVGVALFWKRAAIMKWHKARADKRRAGR